LDLGACDVRLGSVFGRNPVDRAASDLYLAIVEQARQPQFYGSIGVPDTLDGRFEMIVLHAFMVIRRLQELGAGGGQIAQALFDQMFADMDRNLREIGVGDLSVGKHVKRMAKRFYGCVDAYDRGLEATGEDELQAAVQRNVFAQEGHPQAASAALSGYLRREVEALKALAARDLLAGRVQFGPPPESAESHA
jgi:cytochrome b pre-mRNA-processing protein 3